MWNRITQQNIASFEDFIGIYKLCKSRGPDVLRLEGIRQAYAALRAAEVGDEQLFKQAWGDLKLFSRKTRQPHADRMFFDYASFTCRSWTDLILCNLSAEAASLAYKWIDQEMGGFLEEGGEQHVVRTWNRQFKDKVLWRRIAATAMFEYRGARELLFPDTDTYIQTIFNQIFWYRAKCEAAFADLESKHLASILHVEPAEQSLMLTSHVSLAASKTVNAVRRL